jgi:iron(III) transport system substrate-binding protein
MFKALATAAMMTACVFYASTADAADLPKTTQSMLAKLTLDDSFMAGLDKELDVPAAWMKGAEREKTVRITGTWDNDQFRVLSQPFNERYPFVKINYMRGDTTARVQRPLIALKEHRVIADVLTGVGDFVNDFIAIDGLDNLTNFPAYHSVAPGLEQKDGLMVGAKLRYWCMSYNTDALKKEDMPRTWDDLATNAALRGGKLGLANESQLWMMPLAGAKGDAWMTSTITNLFNNLQPQRRKESVNALQNLVVAGEIKAALPAADYRVALYVRKGAPIAWHCPEPVPSAISGLVLIKGSPYTNAAHLFGNWMISKEGQLAQFIADGATPIHKDMQTKEFLAFPDEIKGKPLAFIEPEKLRDEFKAILDVWNPLWNKVQ